MSEITSHRVLFCIGINQNFMDAPCGLLLLGDSAVDPREVDMSTCGMVVEKNGVIISTGAGAAVMGSPVNTVTWLANTLGEYALRLRSLI